MELLDDPLAPAPDRCPPPRTKASPGLLCLAVLLAGLGPPRQASAKLPIPQGFPPGKPAPLLPSGVGPQFRSHESFFRSFYRRITTARLLALTFAVICLGKLLFYFWLSSGGKTASMAFFLFASVYFLLALAVTWGRINDIFSARQSERCFGFVATGATLGSIVGSEMASLLAATGPLSLLVSVAFMIPSLALLLAAHPTAPHPSPSHEETSPGLLSELRELQAHRYLRGIAIMVVGLAVYSTGIDFSICN